MNKYLLDTNILIDTLRGYQPVTKYLEELLARPENFIFISTISEMEVFAGREMSKKEEQTKADIILARFLKIAPESRVARLAGELVRETKMTVADALIAATALSGKMELVTRNRKHFQKISNLKVLSP